MEKILNEIEVRILGSLVEKESTTPDYYPLSLNAITNACNQKSNRDPVVSYDETTIYRTLEILKDKKGLICTISGAGIRHQKYKHNFASKFELDKKELSVMCVLMLRGSQTLGEIRTRTERMGQFESMDEVESVLEKLITIEKQPLVIKIPRQTGQKENRYMHLLCGEPKHENIESQIRPENAVIKVMAENERIAALEEKVVDLQKEIDDVKNEFISFKKQFE